MSNVYGPYEGEVVDWHDGDTCHVQLDLGFAHFLMPYDFDGHPIFSCRIYGINAPEEDTDSGKIATEYAKQLCPPGTRVMVTSHSWDKYGGRFDGSLTLPDGSDFAQHMLDTKNAVPDTGK